MSIHIRNQISQIDDSQQGSILVSIMIVSVFLMTILGGISVLANMNITRAKGRVLTLQAQYAAESGVDSAIANINNGNEDFTSSNGEIEILANEQYRSTYSVAVEPGVNNEKIITASGYVYSPVKRTNATHKQTIRVTAQRSSSSSALSIVSRNIIETGSGVKEIIAKDIYANGYIQMNKNTTNLIAENITVVDKNTSANNCSIGGTGNLVKPSSFSVPAQTKTNIKLGFNNCITPPGNLPNTGFNVLANQTDLSKIQSTLIPWSQFMYNYQDAGSCSEWTTGTSPRTIPSIVNPKKTHYPDSGNNVAASCGTNGSIDMGSNQYNITDHAHIRANLCATTDCEPVFNNPTPDIKFVFIEGTINFKSVRTAINSSPIVLVAYGADPPSKTNLCPYGGAVYVGQGSPSKYTNAPDLYLLATNGICLDDTKFDGPNALGGISGKNIYVATNPGSPFSLSLDPLFPTSLIPIDLAWRAVRYQRL
jgi:hypothetical protein